MKHINIIWKTNKTSHCHLYSHLNCSFFFFERSTRYKRWWVGCLQYNNKQRFISRSWFFNILEISLTQRVKQKNVILKQSNELILKCDTVPLGKKCFCWLTIMASLSNHCWMIPFYFNLCIDKYKDFTKNFRGWIFLTIDWQLNYFKLLFTNPAIVERL